MKKHFKPLHVSKLLMGGALLLIPGQESGLHGVAANKSNPQPPVNREKMNVLFIIVDDLRTELNCFGEHQIISPNIDRLASQGMIFSRAYCQVPVCGASRASLLSGVRASPARFIDYDAYLEKDCPQATSLPSFLKENGYRTISLGKVFHHIDDTESAWSEKPWHPAIKHSRDYADKRNMDSQLSGNSGPAYENCDVPDLAYSDGKIAAKAIEKLSELAKGKQPFFLATGFMKPHLPFTAPRKYWDLYQEKDIHLPDNYRYMPDGAPKEAWHNWGELRNYNGIPQTGPVSDSMAYTLKRGYYASVTYVDAQIGKVLNTLDSLGLRNNTVVVLLGDHGWNIGEHTLWCKHCTFNNVLNAPLIISAPGYVEGKTSNSLAEFIDVYPTICELLNLSPPQHLQGKSIVPVLQDPLNKVNDAVFARWHDGESVKTDRYLYTEWFDASGKPYARMLYDHQKDPEENVNIAKRKENLELVNQLSSMLVENRARTAVVK